MTFKCVTISDSEHQAMRHALLDVICWMDGFTQGGGKYKPETLRKLDDIVYMFDRAYGTIPPSDPVVLLKKQINDLAIEVNCRIEHGAPGKAHLQFVEKKLKEILHP